MSCREQHRGCNVHREQEGMVTARSHLCYFCLCTLCPPLHSRDHLSREPGTRSKLVATLNEVLDAVKALPESSDYRRGLEATCQYRLKVCEANDQEPAIEDVLDSHMEELIQECYDEIKLIPYLNGEDWRAQHSLSSVHPGSQLVHVHHRKSVHALTECGMCAHMY